MLSDWATGPARRLYRGESFGNRCRRTYGLSWTEDATVARSFAVNLRSCRGRTVVLQAEVEAPPITSAVRDGTELHRAEVEGEYLVDRRRLGLVQVIERFSRCASSALLVAVTRTSQPEDAATRQGGQVARLRPWLSISIQSHPRLAARPGGKLPFLSRRASNRQRSRGSLAAAKSLFNLGGMKFLLRWRERAAGAAVARTTPIASISMTTGSRSWGSGASMPCLSPWSSTSPVVIGGGGAGSGAFSSARCRRPAAILS
jgi:hypothetical protein